MWEFLAPNNREWAILSWIGIFIFGSLFYKRIRKSCSDLIDAALNKKIVIFVLVTATYVILLCYALYHIHIWSWLNLKTTILWFFGFALLTVAQSFGEKEPDKVIFISIKNQFTIIFVIEYIRNIYSFNFYAEWIITPILVTIGAMYVVSEKEEKDATTHNILGYIITIYAVCILSYSIYNLLYIANTLEWYAIIQDIAAILILSVAFAPCAYMWALYELYETTFSRMSIFTDNEDLLWKSKIRLLREFHCNLPALSKFTSQWDYKVNNKAEDMPQIIKRI